MQPQKQNSESHDGEEEYRAHDEHEHVGFTRWCDKGRQMVDRGRMRFSHDMTSALGRSAHLLIEDSVENKEFRLQSEIPAFPVCMDRVCLRLPGRTLQTHFACRSILAITESLHPAQNFWRRTNK